MYGPTIPKYGLVETVNAKLFARFDTWSDSYLRMLKGRKPPPHVVALSERYRRERYWEKPDEPKKVAPKPAAKSDGAWWSEVMLKAAAMAPKAVAPVKEEESGDWWADIEAQAEKIKAGQ